MLEGLGRETPPLTLTFVQEPIEEIKIHLRSHLKNHIEAISDTSMLHQPSRKTVTRVPQMPLHLRVKTKPDRPMVDNTLPIIIELKYSYKKYDACISINFNLSTLANDLGSKKLIN